MRILYALSDCIHFLVYRAFGYRTDVVMDNLHRSFPEKSIGERKQIASKFYRNLIDTFLETIKMLSGSDSFVRKRVTGNWEVVNDLVEIGKPIQCHLGHTFNWEWANYMASKNFVCKFLVVYMPIKSKAMDKVFLRIRNKGGTGLIPATPPQEYINAINKYRNQVYAIGLAADQSPGDPAKAFWLSFLGRPTAFINGPERNARIVNLPVVFVNIVKPKRGYYQIEFSKQESHSKQAAEGELTLRFARFLESAIQKNPDMWLWSHRRWKKAWKPEYGKRWIDKENPPPTTVSAK